MLALFGEVHADYAGVLLILLAADDAGSLGTVDKANGAVTLQQQVLGEIPDGRRL